MQIVGYLIMAVSLACWIMVLIKVFQSGDTLWGVLSICPLVGFIYGWVKNKELGLQKVMLVWTACVVVNIVLSVLFRPTM